MNIYTERIPNITLINAPPQSGKTYLIKYILTDLFKTKKVKYGIVFTTTNFTDSYDFIPENYVHSLYNEDIIKNLMEIQVNQIKENKKADPCFLVFDDMIGSIKFNSNIIKKLFSTFRHYNILIIISTQYLFSIPPLIRECTTYFVTFNIDSHRSIKAIYESFMLDFDTLLKVKKFIKEHCIDYHFILIKTFEKKENKYSVMKSPKAKNIKMNY